MLSMSFVSNQEKITEYPNQSSQLYSWFSQISLIQPITYYKEQFPQSQVYRDGSLKFAQKASIVNFSW